MDFRVQKWPILPGNAGSHAAAPGDSRPNQPGPGVPSLPSTLEILQPGVPDFSQT